MAQIRRRFFFLLPKTTISTSPYWPYWLVTEQPSPSSMESLKQLVQSIDTLEGSSKVSKSELDVESQSTGDYQPEASGHGPAGDATKNSGSVANLYRLSMLFLDNADENHGHDSEISANETSRPFPPQDSGLIRHFILIADRIDRISHNNDADLKEEVRFGRFKQYSIFVKPMRLQSGLHDFVAAPTIANPNLKPALGTVDIFHPFPRLPAEVRIRIWKFSRTQPHILNVM